MTNPILWQFQHSHYNDKVRWALDFKRIPHVRRSLLPGPHVPRVLWMTGQKAVPVLDLDGRAIADSTRIIEALEQWRPDPPLYPRDPDERRRALGLEEYFDEEAAYCTSLSTHPAFQWAADMYRRHRGPSMEVAA